jgi:hypothetical protein
MDRLFGFTVKVSRSIAITCVALAICAGNARISSADPREVRVYTYEFDQFRDTFFIRFPCEPNRNQDLGGYFARDFLGQAFQHTGTFLDLRREGASWLPSQAEQSGDPSSLYRTAFKTSVSNAGIITGDALETFGPGSTPWKWSWTLNLNTGEYHLKILISNGASDPCQVSYFSDGVAPLILKDCPDSTDVYAAAAAGLYFFTGSCVVCTVSANSSIVPLHADGQGGALGLTIDNPTTTTCTAYAYGAPQLFTSVPLLNITDQLGRPAVVWTLQPETRLQIDLAISGQSNLFCDPLVVPLWFEVFQGMRTPNIAVTWDPQPSTFDPNLGVFVCTPGRRIPPLTPNRFNPSSWGNPYPTSWP